MTDATNASTPPATAGEGAPSTDQGDDRARPATTPAQAVDETAQVEAGRDRAEGGGYN